MLCMLPGVGAGALLWLVLLSVRRKRPACRGLASGRERECAMLPFWMFSGGMAVITLAPTPEWLLLTLAECRKAGEEKVLLTCGKNNVGSERTILANGGALENEVEDVPGLGKSGIIRRFWITL